MDADFDTFNVLVNDKTDDMGRLEHMFKNPEIIG